MTRLLTLQRADVFDVFIDGRITDEKPVDVRHRSELLAVVSRQRAAEEYADLVGDALAHVLLDPPAKALVRILRALRRRGHSGVNRQDRLVNDDEPVPVLTPHMFFYLR